MDTLSELLGGPRRKRASGQHANLVSPGPPPPMPGVSPFPIGGIGIGQPGWYPKGPPKRLPPRRY